MTTHLRRALAVALCAGAALALTACSSSGGSTTGASSAAAPASATPDPNAGLPNGTELAGRLLSGSVVPSLKADPNITRNSGTAFQDSGTSVVPASTACTQLDQTDWVTSTGVREASFAAADFHDSAGNEFYEEIGAYQGTGATEQLTALKKVFAECKTHKVTGNGSPYTEHVKVTALSGLGDEAVEAVLSSPNYDGGETLVAVRSGKQVVDVMYNDQKTTGAKALTLARELLKKVPAATS
ncbi:hypothetical protein [Streptacidiphilus anmyonensis]|uniref:hypothetical protein n=1 Tax=Streptacidiphilus anmyonensis TaxID=405782 RepID=UPI0005AACE7B|nr:hypothetical protein [Streptacidiphilus anmyonensis]